MRKRIGLTPPVKTYLRPRQPEPGHRFGETVFGRTRHTSADEAWATQYFGQRTVGGVVVGSADAELEGDTHV